MLLALLPFASCLICLLSIRQVSNSACSSALVSCWLCYLHCHACFCIPWQWHVSCCVGSIWLSHFLRVCCNWDGFPVPWCINTLIFCRFYKCLFTAIAPHVYVVTSNIAFHKISSWKLNPAIDSTSVVCTRFTDVRTCAGGDSCSFQTRWTRFLVCAPGAVSLLCFQSFWIFVRPFK